MRARIIRLAAVVAAALVLTVTVCNAVVLAGGAGTSETVAEAPRAQVALVLGAFVHAPGHPSGMLRDRVLMGAALYKSGKVEKVLVSGDHGTTAYDEVNEMRDELLALGVPARDIFCDHAGFDTRDSTVRARDVFKALSVLVVTQRFHLARAVFLARRAGLTAHGVVADRSSYGVQGRRSRLRETLARVKAVKEVVTSEQPRFRGPALPVTGDGRATLG